MDVFTLLLFLLGCVVFIVGIIYLIIQVIRRKERRKALTTVGVGFLFIVIGIALNPGFKGDTPTVSNNTPAVLQNPIVEHAEEPVKVPEKIEYKSLTEEQVGILSKTYTDLTDAEKDLFTYISIDFKYLADEDKKLYQNDFERLLAERKTHNDIKAAEEEEVRKKAAEEAAKKKAEEEAAAKKAEEEAAAKAIAEEKAKWDEFVRLNSKTLGAGTFTAPDHIATGIYDATFSGTGNLFINSNNDLDYNEIGGSRYGISKLRVYLTSGAEIEISGMKVIFTPVKTVLYPATGFKLHSGFWGIGEEIPPGRYEVTPEEGESGNFFVFGRNDVNEILGSSYGVPSVIINAATGDIVNICGMESVTFKPIP